MLSSHAIVPLLALNFLVCFPIIRARQSGKASDLFTPKEQGEIARSDGRERIRGYFRVAQRRLDVIRLLVTKKEYSQANKGLQQLALVYTDAFHFVAKMAGSKKKKDSVWKQMERGLHDQLTYLESLQRDFPFEDSEPIRQLVDHAKDLRIRSLSAIFGPDVLKNPYSDQPHPKSSEHAQ